MTSPRQRILETAGRLFTERGYECVGINEIIEKAEVAKASFYKHFPSKQDLCAAWLRDEADQCAERYQLVLAAPGPLRRKLRAQFDDLVCWVEGNCFRGCPFAVTAAMREAGEESQEVIRRHTADQRSFWQSLARDHVSTAAKARDLGDSWFLLYTGAFTQAQNCGCAWPIKQAKKTALALLSS